MAVLVLALLAIVCSLIAGQGVHSELRTVDAQSAQPVAVAAAEMPLDAGGPCGDRHLIDEAQCIALGPAPSFSLRVDLNDISVQPPAVLAAAANPVATTPPRSLTLSQLSISRT